MSLALDDLPRIHRRDSQDALGKTGKQGLALAEMPAVIKSKSPTHGAPIAHVLVMGGESLALAANLIKSWVELERPVEVCRLPELPAYAGPHTLLIAEVDASGAAERLLQPVLAEAQAKGMQVATVPIVAAESRFNPWPEVGALLTVLEQWQVVHKGCVGELAEQSEWLSQQLAARGPMVPTNKNLAKQLALELLGKSVVIYSSVRFGSLAEYWKQALNRNAKQLAWTSNYPTGLGAAAGDLSGWTKQPVVKPYVVLELCSTFDSAHVRQAREQAQRLLSGMRPFPQTVNLAGETRIQQIAYGVALADMVSIYTALAGDIDPTPVPVEVALSRELTPQDTVH
jgi:hypothetical protein